MQTAAEWLSDKVFPKAKRESIVRLMLEDAYAVDFPAGAGAPGTHTADCNVTTGRRSADHRIHCDCAGASGVPEFTRPSSLVDDSDIACETGQPTIDAHGHAVQSSGTYVALCGQLLAIKARLTDEQCTVLGAALTEYADLLREKLSTAPPAEAAG